MSTETVLRANVRELQEQVSRLQARLAEVIAERDAAVSALQSLSDDIYGLMGESYGVVGLHLNGDVAPWSELEPGGRFERLTSLDHRMASARA